jgi:hypothetical protein
MPISCTSIPPEIDAIARRGGNTCSTIRDRFEMLTPTLDDFSNSAKPPR